MTERKKEMYGDPISAPFWEGATRHELLVQKCRDCGQHQFYPRPICLQCSSVALEWVTASGAGTVYSMTTIRRPIVAGHDPPYVVAIVELDEGVRMLTNIVGDDCEIGDRVQVSWRERADAPPVPVFHTLGG